MYKVLIVEDKQSLSLMLRRALERVGYGAEEAGDGATALRKYQQNHYDLVLTDLKLPDVQGLEVLKSIKTHDPSFPVIVMTAYGSIEAAVDAMRSGAYDFIQKPIDLDHLMILIARALEHKNLLSENTLLKEEFAEKFGVPQIIGEHPSLVTVSQQIQQVAGTNATVLLLGESGTGKELFAKAIHNLSPRKTHPFVTINCAAIPESLIENELFGHEKGSYTGANDRHPGKFDLAHRGTILLDEIGELPMAMQSKILRVLEERKIDRIGGQFSHDIDVRIIAATNKDLKTAVERKEFRDDLFYRLMVFPIMLPALRERKSDIPLLVKYYLNRFTVELKKKGVEVSPEALHVLEEYNWPGNVRELRNCIERAIIICDDNLIQPEDLHINDKPQSLCLLSNENDQLLKLSFAGSLNEVREQAVRLVETTKIKSAIRESGGNKVKAAAILGVSYKTLLTKIKEHGI
jgi:DNA-binding NtrC family response regulator